MTKHTLRGHIYNGEPIECSEKEYLEHILPDLYEIAKEFMDKHDNIRAITTLKEIERLNGVFNFRFYLCP